MKCKPCRVTYQGARYEVSADGTVRPTRIIDKLPPGPGWRPGRRVYDAPVAVDLAKAVRREAARQRRNRNARERADVLRSLGLKKTPYGWE